MTGSSTDPAALLRRVVSPAQMAEPPATVSKIHGPYEEYDIRIARDGTWFYHGSPITRKPLVRLFSTVLHRDSAGDFWLKTPAERGRIHVDDAPFVAVECTVTGHGRDQMLRFRTNVDDIISAGPDHHIDVRTDETTGEPRPYLHVRNGLEALIARPVFYQLADLGVEDAESGAPPRLGVWSGGCFFSLGPLE